MKLTLFSVSYAGTWGNAQLGVEEFVDHAAERGYEAALLMGKRPHASPLDFSRDRRRSLCSRAASAGIELTGIAAYTDFTAVVEDPAQPLLEQQLQYVASCAELAHDLGAPRVRIFTGFERPGVGYPAAWQACLDAVRECGERAAGLGVTIVVQNHHDIANVEIARFVDEVGLDNVHPGYDAWAPALQGHSGKELESLATEHASRVLQTIVADYELRPRVAYDRVLNAYRELPQAVTAVPPGEGSIDYESFLRGLVAGGFDGNLIYEMCSPLRGGGEMTNLDRYARIFLQWASDLLPRIGVPAKALVQ